MSSREAAYGCARGFCLYPSILCRLDKTRVVWLDRYDPTACECREFVHEHVVEWLRKRRGQTAERWLGGGVLELSYTHTRTL